MRPDKPAASSNATRALDARRIAYHGTAYSPDLHTAAETANALGVPLDTRELDLKALAAAMGEKKIRMASHAEAERLTGLQVGGISALALLPKNWRVCLDQSAFGYEQISVSGGRRGWNVRLAPQDFQAVTQAVPVTLS